jgi:hypothetical protein
VCFPVHLSLSPHRVFLCAFDTTEPPYLVPHLKELTHRLCSNLRCIQEQNRRSSHSLEPAQVEQHVPSTCNMGGVRLGHGLPLCTSRMNMWCTGPSEGVFHKMNCGILAPREGAFHRANHSAGGTVCPGRERGGREGVLLPPVNKGVLDTRGARSQLQRRKEKE